MFISYGFRALRNTPSNNAAYIWEDEADVFEDVSYCTTSNLVHFAVVRIADAQR